MVVSHEQTLEATRHASSSPLSSAPESQPSVSPIKPPPLENTNIPAVAVTQKQTMPSRVKKRITPTRTLRKSKWNAENILNDAKSPLATADLRSILSNPTAWEVLDTKEKAEIIALFPDEQHILPAANEEQEACINLATLLSDDSFRRDCAAYTRNIEEGKHDPDWLASAWSAHERRKMGDFDEFLVDEFESAWDVDLPESFKPRRKTASEAAPASTASTSTPPLNTSNGNDTTKETPDEQMDQTRTDREEVPKLEDETHMEVDGDQMHTDRDQALNTDEHISTEGGNGQMQINQDPKSNAEENLHPKPKEPGKKDAITNDLPGDGDAVDELQLEAAPRESDEPPPVKRQRKSCVREADSEDELA